MVGELLTGRQHQILGQRAGQQTLPALRGTNNQDPLGNSRDVLLESGARKETDEGKVIQAAPVSSSTERNPDPGVWQETGSSLRLRTLEDPSDVAALIADHGLLAQLQTVVGIQAGEVSLDQTSQTIVQMDPAGVPADGDVAYPHLRPVEVSRGDDGDGHQDLVQIRLQAAGDLEEGAALLISAGLDTPLVLTASSRLLIVTKTDIKILWQNFINCGVDIKTVSHLLITHHGDGALQCIRFVILSVRYFWGLGLGLVDLLVLHLQPRHLLPQTNHGLSQCVELVSRAQRLKSRLRQLRVFLLKLLLKFPPKKCRLLYK